MKYCLHKCPDWGDLEICEFDSEFIRCSCNFPGFEKYIEEQKDAIWAEIEVMTTLAKKGVFNESN